MLDDEYYKKVQIKVLENKILNIQIVAKDIVEMISILGTGSVESLKTNINKQIDSFAQFAVEKIKKINGE